MKLRASLLSAFLTVVGMTPYLWAHQKVALCQIVEHAALNQMREGLQEKLNDPSIVWTLENAHGSSTLASQVAQKVAGDGYTLIIALGTPMAQAIVASNPHSPILFGAVSDHLASKLVTRIDDPGQNISGVIDRVPPEPIFALIERLLPKAKRIGLIYNPGEANSVAQADDIKQLAHAKGYNVSEAMVSRSSDVMSATKSLLGKVDLILLPTDNTVISALEAITQPASKHKVPVIGVDVDTVRRGALAAVGVDWHLLGHQLGDMAKKVLAGAKPHTLPVEGPDKYHMHINLKTAEIIGLEVDKAIIEEADKVYQP